MDYNELFEQAVKELTAAGATAVVYDSVKVPGVTRIRFSLLGVLGTVQLVTEDKRGPFVEVGSIGSWQVKVGAEKGDVLKAFQLSFRTQIDQQSAQYKEMEALLKSMSRVLSKNQECDQALDALIKAQGESSGAGKAVP